MTVRQLIKELHNLDDSVQDYNVGIICLRSELKNAAPAEMSMVILDSFKLVVLRKEGEYERGV